MATCKDCIHYDLCRSCSRIQLGWRGNSVGYVENVEEICEHFKDRSRFVELPCEVGDTVYMIAEHTEKVGRKKVTNNIIVECGVDNFRIGDLGYPSAALCDSENNWWYGIEPTDFGKTVFLTREEAEQALKERENNEK